MPYRINDLALGTGSTVRRINDSAIALTLELQVTPAERRALQEMAEHAGRLTEHTPPLARTIVIDGSPNGENLLFFQANDDTDQAAQSLMDDGWALWAAVDDEVAESPTLVTLNATLRRVCGREDAEGVTSAVMEFISHDF